MSSTSSLSISDIDAVSSIILRNSSWFTEDGGARDWLYSEFRYNSSFPFLSTKYKYGGGDSMLLQ